MRDYTKYTFFLSLLVLAGMVGLSFVPSFSVAGVKFKRTNIISDLYLFGDEPVSDDDAALSREDLDFVRDMEDAANYADEGEETVPGTEETPAEEQQPAQQTWDFGGETASTSPTGGTDAGAEGSQVSLENVTLIEDYSPDGAIHRFGALLGSATQTRNVRIAFLGDSFIEGDIITADVREQLQTSYGGRGIGFVTLASITAEYRPTVKHTFRGWKDYLLANKKNVPEEFRDRFYVSGIISTARADSWSQYETSTYRKHVDEVSTVRFFYSSDSDAEITFKVNDTHEKAFPADTSGQVRQINISGGGIKKVRVSVPATEGFAGYGLSLEGSSGVLVDNYSIRSSTGLSLFGTSSAVNTDFNRMLGYDLIVLQYGLNIMSAEVTSYKNYGEQFRNLVRYIQRCFPSAAIIVMGVGDRSMLSNGEFVTMPAVPAMVKEQRSIAEDCQVAFWNTYEAMGGYNSMRRFGDWGWAAKDYTHLSFGGGRKIATELVKAIEYAKLYRYYPEGTEPEEVLEEAEETVIPAPMPSLLQTTVPETPVEPAAVIPAEEPAPSLSPDWDFDIPSPDTVEPVVSTGEENSTVAEETGEGPQTVPDHPQGSEEPEPVTDPDSVATMEQGTLLEEINNPTNGNPI